MSKNFRLAIYQITEENNQLFQLKNLDDTIFAAPRVSRILKRYQSFFIDSDAYIFKQNLSYVSLLEFVNRLNKALESIDEQPLLISNEFQKYIDQNRYAITEQQLAGSTIKSFDPRWSKELSQFKQIIDRELSRPLINQQVQASFYLATMKRAANFSVPGSGKTAMMYGAFGYLSSQHINEVNKILVICPINAFEAWRTEFLEVFGNKRNLQLMNLRDSKYTDFGKIRMDWATSNVIIINYESLVNRVNILNELIDGQTMMVFDEVHRVKGIGRQRATAALGIGKAAKYRYVLTGTPIPNTYKDIYNFLHILYEAEYDAHFGWEVSDLENPDPDEINAKVQPFFWRTNKDDLKVPKADPDNLFSIKPNQDQLDLAKVIYQNERNILSLYLRLLQASTNPALLIDQLDYYDLGFTDDEIELTQFNALTKEEHEQARVQAYLDMDVTNIRSEKFHHGIELIMDLVNEDKKVIVWAIFVKTMHKIVRELENQGVLVNLVYGSTPREERVELINQFRNGQVQVLVSNPHTLGESISLHQTVHDAVYFEFNFNLTFMLQSRDRIHRLGLPQDQYTRYHYLMTEGDRAHQSFIDNRVYWRLKEKEDVMIKAIDGDFLIPEVPDSYLEDIKRIISV